MLRLLSSRVFFSGTVFCFGLAADQGLQAAADIKKVGGAGNRAGYW
jgi:hypothetical protein